MKKNKISTKLDKKISSTDRLEDLLEEAEKELADLEPKIDKLEKQLEKLKELKLAKQKLITLKLSIKSILNNFSENKVYSSLALETKGELSELLSSRKLNSSIETSQGVTKTSHFTNVHSAEGTFVPERAFAEVSEVLRKKTSINYELFRAVVFNGGRASTEAIKQYLIENNIKQPGNGESFEAVELTDISSRVNYLVRKGVVTPDGRGAFRSCFGWL